MAILLLQHASEWVPFGVQSKRNNVHSVLSNIYIHLLASGPNSTGGLTASSSFPVTSWNKRQTNQQIHEILQCENRWSIFDIFHMLLRSWCCWHGSLDMFCLCPLLPFKEFCRNNCHCWHGNQSHIYMLTLSCLVLLSIEWVSWMDDVLLPALKLHVPYCFLLSILSHFLLRFIHTGI